jgi:hypothetical protein
MRQGRDAVALFRTLTLEGQISYRKIAAKYGCGSAMLARRHVVNHARPRNISSTSIEHPLGRS